MVAYGGSTGVGDRPEGLVLGILKVDLNRNGVVWLLQSSLSMKARVGMCACVHSKSKLMRDAKNFRVTSPRRTPPRPEFASVGKYLVYHADVFFDTADAFVPARLESSCNNFGHN